jgi:hypothetical protein
MVLSVHKKSHKSEVHKNTRDKKENPHHNSSSTLKFISRKENKNSSADFMTSCVIEMPAKKFPYDYEKLKLWTLNELYILFIFIVKLLFILLLILQSTS